MKTGTLITLITLFTSTISMSNHSAQGGKSSNLLDNTLYNYTDTINSFEVQLPIEWNIIREKKERGVIAISNEKTKAQFNPNITVIKTPLPEITPEQFQESLLNSLNSRYKDLEVITTGINGNKVSISYKMKVKEVALHGTSVNYLSNLSNYSITCISVSSSFPKYANLFKQVSNSLIIN